jgi:hypothetical protein
MGHAPRARADPGIDPETISDRLGVDVERYTRVLIEQETWPTVVRPDPLTDRPEHLTVTLRFDDSDPRDEIVQLLSAGTLRGSEWVVVHVHDCEHDRDDGGGCGDWQLAVERGDPPEVFR